MPNKYVTRQEFDELRRRVDVIYDWSAKLSPRVSLKTKVELWHIGTTIDATELQVYDPRTFDVVLFPKEQRDIVRD